MEQGKLADYQKKAEQEKSLIGYQDEAGICLLPTIGYSDAPCGQRPIIKADSKNKLKLSLAVVITGEGQMYYQVRHLGWR